MNKLLYLLARLIRQEAGNYEKIFADYARIKGTIFYVKTIDFIRRLAVFCAVGFFFLALVIAGLIILPLALLVYAVQFGNISLSAAVIVVALVYLLPGIAGMLFIFSEGRWLRKFKGDRLINQIMRESVKNNSA